MYDQENGRNKNYQRKRTSKSMRLSCKGSNDYYNNRKHCNKKDISIKLIDLIDENKLIQSFHS
jgi:hypothetical protein